MKKTVTEKTIIMVELMRIIFSTIAIILLLYVVFA